MSQPDDFSEIIVGERLLLRQRRVVSPGVAEIPGKGLGFIKGFLARDPDGHGLQLIEK
jgi:hypothetical protein